MSAIEKIRAEVAKVREDNPGCPAMFAHNRASCCFAVQFAQDKLKLAEALARLAICTCPSYFEGTHISECPRADVLRVLAECAGEE